MTKEEFLKMFNNAVTEIIVTSNESTTEDVAGKPTMINLFLDGEIDEEGFLTLKKPDNENA